MAETFQATRDAVGQIVRGALSKRPKREKTPWYLEDPDFERPKGLTPETGLDAEIMRFVAKTGRTMVPIDGGAKSSSPGKRIN